jgi:hypothetical protein
MSATQHKAHKKHNFLDGEALILLQEKLNEGMSYHAVAKLLKCDPTTVRNFDPKRKEYRDDLFRIRTQSKNKFRHKGQRKSATLRKQIDNTAVRYQPMKGISFEASEYIHACALVFKKSHAQILDEMVKACKKLKAVTLHDK